MDLAWRVINLLGILFTAAMTLVTLFTYRVPRRMIVRGGDPSSASAATT